MDQKSYKTQQDLGFFQPEPARGKYANPADERPIKGSSTYNLDQFEFEENFSEKETASSDSHQLQGIIE